MKAHCPILDRESAVEPTKYSRGDWNVVRCCETGLVFLANPPDYARLETEFSWDKTGQQERERRAAQEPIVTHLSDSGKWLKSKLSPRRNKMFQLARFATQHARSQREIHVLDIGCGWGALMQRLDARFADLNQRVIPYGIEVSKELAARSAEQFEPLGGHVIQDNALNGAGRFDAGCFDLIVMWCFLEHERHPLRLLKSIRPRLREGGSILIKVPNFNCLNRHLRGRRWCGFRYPDHVQYFTPQTLNLLAQEAGYVVARQNLFDRPPLSDNMYAILQPAKLASVPARRAA